ncbi:MAG: nucleotidyltransferase domain-containing protein [Candidatus Magnetomorum sp.]|nr:nucleotidyltransferase domain-containing protein [Candidatus Magnetomorum sp.]
MNALNIKQVVSIFQQQKMIIKRDFAWIHVLYLFGSYAKGTATANSDIDIAIFIDTKTYKIMNDLEFAVFLEQKCKKETEILVMQKVSPIVQHEVLKTGIRLYESDPIKRSQLELQSFRHYLDAKYLLEKQIQLRKHYDTK